MKAIHYVALLLCTPLYNACNSSKPVEQKTTVKDNIPVQVMMLNQEHSNAPVTVSGEFTTDDEVMLSFKTGGIINRVLVKEGDAVRKGQLLATLNLTEINAQVQQVQLNQEKAKRDYQRIKNLYADSVATLEQLQNSKTALQLAEQQVNLVAFNRRYSEIHASQDGFILKKLADAGQQVSPGTAVLQTNGAQSGKWLLKVGISDQEWALLKLNDPAKVETAALPGQFMEGFLSRKSEGVDPATGTFTAHITLTGKKPQIASGMFGKAIISPSGKTEHKGVWKIPYEALLDGDGNTGYVFITNDDKTAKKVKVTIAGIEDHTVTISDGLQDAKGLIVSGSAYLTDQSAITIHSPLKEKK
ncbi:efflux RND transporter periplasmic adaptor subunit [Pedobacter sp. KBW06]|uniref:efflux RND transporter periplasmic adaptor subunit n=1 Tax=Pedobacter sp. KBW06 TaxID=2153359 RepID=UPI000F590396|nr:efflux RND transporter periplasmic adaptor subunit [Pedobacter sp. KBW06]RQO73860.1 efflux RND transporter periplasmic adaptor subunit [Pedobacter sp. KBW06]